MPSEYSFSAQDWIKEHLHDGVHLDPECLQALQNFTLMWNLFESLLCGTNANVSTFKNIVANINHQGQSIPLIESFAFFKTRYLSQNGFSSNFKNLRFRNKEQQDIVEKIIKSESPSICEIVLATTFIVYRLRNNLFHGVKSISSLNNQTTNLNVAARALAAIIELHGHPALTRSNHAASR